jgi:hypothetical protein
MAFFIVQIQLFDNHLKQMLEKFVDLLPDICHDQRDQQDQNEQSSNCTNLLQYTITSYASLHLIASWVALHQSCNMHIFSLCKPMLKRQNNIL